MSPPWKSKVSLQPVDTSSQASVEEAEASLEDLPTNISPVATAYSSRSVSPLMDPSELQANANRAINNMLHLKRPIDVKRQRAIWELGEMLHQNESQEAASVAEAKAICSQATLNAWTICSQLALEAKTNFLVAVEEAKTNRGHSVQEAKAASSKAISKARAQRISQAVMLHKEHGRYMQGLEEQAFGEESRSCHDFLSSSQVALCHSPQPLRGALVTLYHILLGKALLLPPPILPKKTPPVEEQPPTAAPPTPMPKQSPRPKRQHPLPELMGSMLMGGAHPKGYAGRTPSPKKQETPPWFKSLKPSNADAFLRDPSIVIEARLHFFSKHSYNFTGDSNSDLSRIFKILAVNTGLLGNAIYEIQSTWTGPEELKQANYTLQSLPKGLKFLRTVPAPESPKVMGLVGIHDPDALQCFAGFTYCPWCGKEGQNEETVINHLCTVHYRLGLVCDRCYGCPYTISDNLCCHGHHDCCQLHAPSESVPSN